jgi:hypothetical protein
LGVALALLLCRRLVEAVGEISDAGSDRLALELYAMKIHMTITSMSVYGQLTYANVMKQSMLWRQSELFTASALPLPSLVLLQPSSLTDLDAKQQIWRPSSALPDPLCDALFPLASCDPYCLQQAPNRSAQCPR